MIELVAKVTLLLGSCALLALLLRNRSASLRHFVWALALGGALLLPAALELAPKIGVRLPAIVEDRMPPPPPAVRRFEHVGGSEVAPASVPAPSRAPARASAPGPASKLPADRLLALLWALGSLVVLGRCLAGHVGLALIAMRARTVDSDEFTELFNELRLLSRSWRPIRVAMSREISSPVTWGFGSSPTILLPPDAESWSVDRMRVVLLHELAHVARRDDLTQLLGHLACALYWFHPLAWIAARELREESEHAADDRVLNSGASAPEYADHLVGIARRVRSLRFVDAVALYMARPSQLERRVRAVLDEDRPRFGISLLAHAGVVVLVSLVMVPLVSCEREVEKVQEIAEPTIVHEDLAGAIHASGGERLDISSPGGGSVDVKGWDRDRVEVNGEHVQIHRESGLVRLSVDPARGSDLEVRVPRRFDITLHLGGGDIAIADVEGNFSGRTGGGSITLRRTRGVANLRTGGGDVEVSDSTLDGKVVTGGGSISLDRIDGDLRGISGSGPVTYEKGGVRHVEMAGGDVDLDAASEGAVLSTGGGDINLGSASGDVRATTGGGDIRLARIAGSVHASTGAGDVRVHVLEAGRAQVIDLFSGTGDVILELPDGFNATFDLETSYTDGRGPSTIVSGWHLERTESGDGTDRYVRARGTVGDGRHRVRVRTFNGDILLRPR